MESLSFLEDRLPSDRILILTAKDLYLDQLEAVTKALGSEKRLAILRMLGRQTCSVLDIAETLEIPQSTATLHINILENAGLIKTDLQPAKRGLQKICARLYDRIVIQLPSERYQEEQTVDIDMPIGAYVEAQVTPTCGLAGELGIIGHLDSPGSFFEPERIYAQLLWFRKGFVEYRFPNRIPPGAILESLELSFEVCSEAPLYQSNWPSDITVWINGLEIGTWTSPSDFGGERGLLTPSWWGSNNSQYGLLKVWKLTTNGCYIDGMRTSSTGLQGLQITSEDSITVRIGLKEDAHNVGGLNLFGSKFGNYPQDLVLRQRFRRGELSVHQLFTEVDSLPRQPANKFQRPEPTP